MKRQTAKDSIMKPIRGKSSNKTFQKPYPPCKKSLRKQESEEAKSSETKKMQLVNDHVAINFPKSVRISPALLFSNKNSRYFLNNNPHLSLYQKKYCRTCATPICGTGNFTLSQKLTDAVNQLALETDEEMTPRKILTSMHEDEYLVFEVLMSTCDKCLDHPHGKFNCFWPPRKSQFRVWNLLHCSPSTRNKYVNKFGDVEPAPLGNIDYENEAYSIQNSMYNLVFLATVGDIKYEVLL